MQPTAPWFIRHAGAADAGAFLELCLALDAESEMMMLEPGERSRDPQASALQIDSITRSGVLLVAEHASELVGYLSFERGAFRRNRHSATLVLGVRQNHQKIGIGSRLLQAAAEWGSEQGVSRLELTVRVDNERAVRLYTRAGFTTEGVRKRSLIVGKAGYDEYLMARLLP